MRATAELVPGSLDGHWVRGGDPRAAGRQPHRVAHHAAVSTPSRDRSAVEPRWIDDDRALAELVKILVDEPAYGLDTEFISERTYWPQLCLVQVSWAQGVALVDPLACDVRALETVLRAPGDDDHARGRERPADPGARRSGARPSALFDVQLAAGFVGLGLPSLGSLVSVLLGIRLDKSEQLADWSARPLSDATRRYAAADVEHLFPLTVELDHRLQDLGRETWAASECEHAARDRRPAHRPRRRVVEDQGRVVDAGREGARSRSPSPRGASDARNGSTCCRASCCPTSRSPRWSAVRRRRATSCSRCAASTGCPTTWCASCSTRSRPGARCPSEQLRAAREAPTTVPSSTPRSRCSSPTSPSSRAPSGSRSSCSRPRDDVKALVYGRPSRLDSGWRAEVAGDAPPPPPRRPGRHPPHRQRPPPPPRGVTPLPNRRRSRRTIRRFDARTSGTRRGGQEAAVRAVGEHRERRQARQHRDERRPRADRERRVAPNRPIRSTGTTRPSRSRTTSPPTRSSRTSSSTRASSRCDARRPSAMAGGRRGLARDAILEPLHDVVLRGDDHAAVRCAVVRRGSRRCRRPRTPWS